MTKLSSNEVRNKVIEAGIKYIPASKYFYSDFPFKIELSPKFRGLGKINGKRGCQIDVSNPTKAREDLAKFNDKIEKLIHNAEHRAEIHAFVNGLADIQFKARTGGDNSIFYFVDPAIVLMIVDQYADVINSITGPINKDHENTIDKSAIVLRSNLYFHKFRYYLEFMSSQEFFENQAANVKQVLNDLDPNTYRNQNLDKLMKHYTQAHPLQPWHSNDYVYRPKSVIIYLTDPEIYVYLKLLAGEYVKYSYEVKLFNELSPDK